MSPKFLFRINILILFITLGVDALAQKRFVIEIDRINDTRVFKQIDFKNGVPVESICQPPSVQNGDIITVRMINFNELLFTMNINQRYKQQETSALSKVIETSAPLLDIINLPNSIFFLRSLSTNPPTAIERDDVRAVGDEVTLADTWFKFEKIVDKVSSTQNDLNAIINHEGLTLDSIKKQLDQLTFEFNVEDLTNSLNDINNRIKNIDDKEANTEHFRRLKYMLSNYSEDNIKLMQEHMYNLSKLISTADFIQERTFIVTNKNANTEKINVDVLVIKRGSMAKSEEEFLPFYNEEEGFLKGDQIHQNIRVNLNVKHTNRVYFNVGINQIFIPKNKIQYATEMNESSDSFAIKSDNIGGMKTTFGVSINYDLPNLIPNMNSSVLLGYSVLFNSNSTASLSPTSVKKGFLMTGIAFSPLKLKFFSASIGGAWSKFDYLKLPYESNTTYPGSIASQEERDRVFSRKIGCSFFLGLNFNL